MTSRTKSFRRAEMDSSTKEKVARVRTTAATMEYWEEGFRAYARKHPDSTFSQFMRDAIEAHVERVLKGNR